MSKSAPPRLGFGAGGRAGRMHTDRRRHGDGTLGRAVGDNRTAASPSARAATFLKSRAPDPGRAPTVFRFDTTARRQRWPRALAGGWQVRGRPTEVVAAAADNHQAFRLGSPGRRVRAGCWPCDRVGDLGPRQREA